MRDTPGGGPQRVLSVPGCPSGRKNGWRGLPRESGRASTEDAGATENAAHPGVTSKATCAPPGWPGVLSPARFSPRSPHTFPACPRRRRSRMFLNGLHPGAAHPCPQPDGRRAWAKQGHPHEVLALAPQRAERRGVTPPQGGLLAANADPRPLCPARLGTWSVRNASDSSVN